MKTNNKLYCTNCKKITNHTPKLSAIMDGAMVCTKCSKMNGFCTLLKLGDEFFEKHSKDIRWVEFENDIGKAMHLNPEIGYSLMMSPFNDSFTWMTTVVSEIIEKNENYVEFKTENSVYKLYHNVDKLIK
jgi:NAD-dependent SIR2 family protein deacetylase